MNRDLNQFFTPSWAAELLVQRNFADLGPQDCVAEPSCGDGRFLMAIPPEVQAYGVEIDPAMAEEARRNSGRPVICDDFLRAKKFASGHHGEFFRSKK
jgi:adenine-specific DNA-methyltransferase